MTSSPRVNPQIAAAPLAISHRRPAHEPSPFMRFAIKTVIIESPYNGSANR